MKRFDVTGIDERILFSRHKVIPPHPNKYEKDCAWCIESVSVREGVARYEPDRRYPDVGEFAVYHKLCLEFMTLKFSNRSRREVGRIIKERCRLDGNKDCVDALDKEGNAFCKEAGNVR